MKRRKAVMCNDNPASRPSLRSGRGFRWLATGLPALMCVAVLACGDGSGAEGEGAGNEVNNPLQSVAAAPSWRLSDMPVWEAKTEEQGSVAPLDRVEGAATISGERVAVLHREGVRIFDSGGHFQTQFGRPGTGPGEFSTPFDLVTVGDSLVVFDVGSRRITVFSPNGELIAVTPPLEPARDPSLLSVLDDGSFLVTDDLWEGRPEEFIQIDRQYLRFSPAGVLIDTIAQHAFAEIGWVSDPGVRTTKTFGAIASSAPGVDGFWATTGGPEAVYCDQSGGVRRIVKWETESRRVSDRDVADYVDRVVATRPAQRAPAVRTRLANTPVAKEFPAARNILGALDGMLWVEEYRPAPSPPRWLVFDSVGLVTAKVVLPPRSTLYEANQHYVLLKVTDELGVESVRKYLLHH